MVEFAELTQTNTEQDDQSYIVSFPKLDKRETVPAASHCHRVGAKPKQHTKLNQQVDSGHPHTLQIFSMTSQNYSLASPQNLTV